MYTHGIRLVVDNTFSPMIFSPLRLGAHIVTHSMTKFINGTSDCVAGCVCSTKEFIDSLMDINSGAGMLLGPVLDSFRSASILKNLHRRDAARAGFGQLSFGQYFEEFTQFAYPHETT